MAVVLSSLYSRVRDELVLKGGTYLWLFHGLERASEDLDFTCVGTLEHGSLVRAVLADLGRHGAPATSKEELSDQSFTARLAIEGPLFDGRNRNHLRLEMSLRGELTRPAMALVLRSPYVDVSDFSLLGMDLEEVLAEKVRAMLWRSRARDLYDIHHLMSRGVKLTRGLLADKLAYYDLSLTRATLESALEEIGDNWGIELAPLLRGRVPEFGTIAEEARNLLGPMTSI
jgi:predicted nucleotidyltransferase component of viral defense system